jgi:hypothetical protein
MQRRWRFVWLGVLLSACAPSAPAPPAHTGLGAAPPAVGAAVQAQAVQPQECEAVTSIEIVHRVGGAQVTDKVRLEPGTSADPAQALRGFQRAADYFGRDNIISTRPITEVMCFPAAPRRRPRAALRPRRGLAGSGGLDDRGRALSGSPQFRDPGPAVKDW